MHLYVKVLFLFTTLGCITSAGLLVWYFPQKPTRAECIIGFNLDWSEASDKAERNQIMNVILTWKMPQQMLAVKRRLRAEALTEDDARLYLQFSNDCGQKREMAETLIAFWRTSGMPLPRFQQMADPIMPSVSTIEVCNTNLWRDCFPSKQIKHDDACCSKSLDRR